MTKIGGLGKLSEGFLGSVDQIEEPILILLLPENLVRYSNCHYSICIIPNLECSVTKLTLNSMNTKKFTLQSHNFHNMTELRIRIRPRASPVQLRHGHGDGGQVGVVHQDEECLCGVELEAAPDDLDELADCDVVGDQELGLVQHRQLLLSAEPLDDAGDLAGVLRPDLLHVLHTQRCNKYHLVI